MMDLDVLGVVADLQTPAQVVMAMALRGRTVRLPARLQKLCRLRSEGLSNKEAAHRLGITEGTVKVYASHIRDCGLNTADIVLVGLALRLSGKRYTSTFKGANI